MNRILLILVSVLILVFSSTVVYGETKWCKGYRDGYKSGYASVSGHQRSSPRGCLGRDDKSIPGDAYQRGFVAGVRDGASDATKNRPKAPPQPKID